MRALDDQVRLGKILYPAFSNWATWETRCGQHLRSLT
jgi:aryl-alcohol dehydrogenase-like predicted oxidoreductase